MLQCSWCKKRIWFGAKHFLSKSFHYKCGGKYLKSQFEEIDKRLKEGYISLVDASIELLKLEKVKFEYDYKL